MTERKALLPGEKTNSRAQNRIVGVNAERNIFLVEANSSREIIPDGCELPAHVLKRGKKWAVVFGEPDVYRLEDVLRKVTFYPAKGSIIARQQNWTDEVNGYSHNYVVLDSHSIPQKELEEIEARERATRDERYVIC